MHNKAGWTYNFKFGLKLSTYILCLERHTVQDTLYFRLNRFSFVSSPLFVNAILLGLLGSETVEKNDLSKGKHLKIIH